MRATKEGGLVNLLPCDVPEDIYQYIADKVIAVVEEDAKREPEDEDDFVPTVARLKCKSTERGCCRRAGAHREEILLPCAGRVHGRRPMARSSPIPFLPSRSTGPTQRPESTSHQI